LSLSASSVRSFGGKKVSTSKTPSLQRRRLHLADERAQVEVLPGSPRVLDEVRQQHELAAREWVGLDADEPQQAGHRALDLVPERLGLGVPRQGRRLQRADEVERHAGVRPGRVDRHLGRVAQRLDPPGIDALGLEPLAPVARRLGGEVVDRDARGAGVLLMDPRPEIRGRESGEREQQVPHVALGVEDERRNAGEQCLLEQHDAQSGLARSRHADNHAVGREVGGVDRERLALGETELEVSHRPSLAPAR
jgi:hypothetical protein